MKESEKKILLTSRWVSFNIVAQFIPAAESAYTFYQLPYNNIY
jgi:hypothetical protein